MCGMFWCRETLGRAGKAFDGLEALLGGGRNGTFDLQVRQHLLIVVRAHLCMHLNFVSVQQAFRRPREWRVEELCA